MNHMRDFATHRHLWRYRVLDFIVDTGKGLLCILFLYGVLRGTAMLADILKAGGGG